MQDAARDEQMKAKVAMIRSVMMMVSNKTLAVLSTTQTLSELRGVNQQRKSRSNFNQDRSKRLATTFERRS
jgi:hypothetical protein